MQIPIIHDGRRIGVLETRREGAYTRFEARCAFLPGIRRLCVFGGGEKRAALGVMQPEGGALTLRRRLSRAAMRAFPQPIEYAGFEERKTDPPPAAESGRIEAAGVEGFFFTEYGVRYLALPCALRRTEPGVRVREIDGRRYLLFRC